MDKAMTHRHLLTPAMAGAIKLALISIVMSLAFFASDVHAAKYVDSVIGGAAGSGSGQLNTPRGLAFNDPGIADGTTDPKGASTDGYLYVVEEGNHRVQVFDADGNFKFMFGRNVVKSGGTGDIPGSADDQQTVTASGTGGTFTLLAPNNLYEDAPQGNEIQTMVVAGTGGTFTLSFPNNSIADTTGSIPRNASSANVDTALEALPAVGAGNVNVTGPAGGPWEVEFTGALANTNVNRISAGGGNLTGSPKSATVLDGQLSAPIPRNATAEEVKATLEAFAAIGAGDVSVAGPAGGPWVLDFTGAPTDSDVVTLIADGALLTGPSAGATVVASGSRSEVCSVAGQCRGGSPGSGAGEFNRPYDIDVNQQTGDVYVSDGANRRVQQFTAAGTFIRAWGWGVDNGAAAFQVCDAPVDLPCQAGIAGVEGGQFGADIVSPKRPGVTGVAVDSVAPHHVFVFDSPNLRIQEFAADGSFVRLWGWDVVPTGQPGDRGNGDFPTKASSFEVCGSTSAGRCKAARDMQQSNQNSNDIIYPRDGSFWGIQGGGNNPYDPSDLAIDRSTGIVYAPMSIAGSGGQYTGDRIQRFDSDETEAAALLLPHLASSFYLVEFATFLEGVIVPNTAGQIDALASRPDTGNLLVARRAPAGVITARTQELDLSTDPPQAAEDHLTSTGLTQNSLAVDPASDDFYFTSTSAGFHRVYIADDDGAPPPVVTLNPPVVNGLDASFSGTVTPGGPPGFSVTYNFQYSKDGVNWTNVPATDNPLGDGLASVPVTDSVTGLDPNTTYKLRLLTKKAFGNPDVASANQVEFTTVAIAPTARTVSPAVRRSTSARIAARINPNNSPTNYYFEWGTDTSYGNRIPIPDGVVNGLGERGAFADIDGLTPNTTYHYKVIADNGVGGPAEGADVAFTTRETPAPRAGERAYEMVTPPFKVARGTGSPTLLTDNNPNPSVASLDGEKVSWSIHLFPLTDDVRHPFHGDRRLIRRTDSGWVNSTRNTLPLLGDPGSPFQQSQFTKFSLGGSSGDFETQTLKIGDNPRAHLLPSEGAVHNPYYTRRDGTGTEGFTPWLANPAQQVIGHGFTPEEMFEVKGNDVAIFNDSGSAMVRSGRYRGLAGPGDPSIGQLAGKAGGATVYLQRAGSPDAMPTAPVELINGCTGTTAGGDATRIPRRQGAGVETDTIVTTTCQLGSATSRRGARVGASSGPGGSNSSNTGPYATALSDDGNRVYFQSPDLTAEGVQTSACTPVTGANSDCVPQLYLRTHKSDGTPVVRWISHSRSVTTGSDNGYTGAMIAGQQVGLMGAGAAFQGASRDGSVVYFKTDAPLTPDDPNATGTPGPKTTGAASANSWDLYRFELPADPDADPDTGTLTRISGGLSGTADPSTNVAGADAPLRFHSDDGSRAYFVTTAPILGADATPPSGGDTTPGGTPGNTSTRNLYLFDDDETGPDRYRFIGRLPYTPSSLGAGVSKGALNACASSAARLTDQLAAYSGESVPRGGNCFRGTPDGSAVAFATMGQLTADDGDEAGDVYLYDAEADELVRASAPPAGEVPYGCNLKNEAGGVGVEPIDASDITAHCNAELGRNSGVQSVRSGLGLAAPIGEWDESRGWGGMRYYNLSVDKAGVVSLFFQSKLALIEEDENQHFDVYEWRQGELSLITPGNSPHNAYFAGNSTDGQDVFFQTGQRIDPREVDDEDLDIYDARVGGGFPYTPPATPCDVLVFQCEVEATPAPRADSAATLGAASSGNVAKAPPKCTKPKVKRKGRCVKPDKPKKSKSKGGKRAKSSDGRESR